MTNIVIQSFENKLQEDFLFFLEHFKEPFDALPSDSEKEMCKVITVN